MGVFKRLFPFMIVFLMSFSFYTQKGEAAEQNHLNINILPASSFIHVENLAPGDEITSSLKVETSDRLGADITLDARMISGSRTLYHELQLAVSTEDQLLYKGSLADFQNRKITAVDRKGRTIFFTVSFPKQSGNEFQKQTTNVAFDFNGSASISFGSNHELPLTATNSHDYLVAGAALLLIGLLLLKFQKVRTGGL